jgi:hypothetical protein
VLQQEKHCEGSSDFLFTEHLTLNWNNFFPSSCRKFDLQKFELWRKVRFIDKKNLIAKIFSFELQKFALWKKHNTESIGVSSGNMNSLRVMENSRYRRSSYKSSTVRTKFSRKA